MRAENEDHKCRDCENVISLRYDRCWRCQELLDSKCTTPRNLTNEERRRPK